jgi:hypothetical protein
MQLLSGRWRVIRISIAVFTLLSGLMAVGGESVSAVPRPSPAAVALVTPAPLPTGPEGPLVRAVPAGRPSSP